MKKHLNVQNLVIGLLIILVINNIVGWFIPQGISHEQMKTEIKLHDLQQEKVVLEEQNNHLQFQINSFKDEILKNDSIIDNSSITEIDSMFSDYFGR